MVSKKLISRLMAASEERQVEDAMAEESKEVST